MFEHNLQSNPDSAPGSSREILTSFVRDLLATVEKLQAGEKKEFTLPDGIDFTEFVRECGLGPQRYEIGGVFNPDTRSLIVARGHGINEKYMFSTPSVEFVKPRVDDAGFMVDNFWHTHPRTEDTRVSPAKQRQGCLPSNEDHSVLLSLWLIDYEYGKAKPIRSIIGSNGYVSVTTFEGIHLDEEKLRAMGITDKQLTEVKSLLALGPQIWIGNLAMEGKREELCQLVENYYKKKHQQDGSFSKDIKILLNQAQPLLRIDRTAQEARQRLQDAIVKHLPTYFQKHRLTNIGISLEVADTIMQMLRITTEVKDVS